ncbi:type I restriction endonuclease subunit R [Nocardioides nematodiphilus]|uniref:type I restriction endonuclease subunit R n=1 Tax=Nocardioides nematodiphilus TaxID=2849669 RepID=UPI001CD9B7E1|nr:type I restriction endonuclease subunit R [Nocardioides nematodiphilus]MCA1982959.1 type I restriction endonuclease subunit R [Nocardioides nematodiphilus]
MTEAPDSSLRYEPIAVSDESTVVAAYVPDLASAQSYQSEAALEQEFIEQLQSQAYERLMITSAADLEANLRTQLEILNEVTFSDDEWARFFAEKVAVKNEGIVEKTARIQEDPIQVLLRDDGTSKNIKLIDKSNIHNNRVQVINQYESVGEGGGVERQHRYDVTVLVNGLPLVHVEIKRRGVALKEAFNQINRYQRESFWADAGLFEYVQLFVISNGTHTKYYANTTRARRIAESEGGRRGKKQTSNTFEFTSWWTDANNKRIGDLTAFTKTFFAKHTLLNVLTKYCVFDVSRTLLVMRPYQIVAAEKILQRVVTSTTMKQLGSTAAGGYIWHTTGSGKTLTSFKTAQLASRMEGVDKVLFVVDRKDLDYQTMLEYNRFEKDSVNGSRSTAELTRQLENPNSRIIVTTIQKLFRFIGHSRGHVVFGGHIVVIFDECHRSQFGDMGTAIRKAFKRYHLFGFTGTPIFPENATGAKLDTTEAVFGDRLHTYTIVDAINDGNVLPFRVSYLKTVKVADHVSDKDVEAINTEEVMLAPERVSQNVSYVLDHFDTKTMRGQGYNLGEKRVRGFNSMFATASIPALKAYYLEFERQQAARKAADPAYQPLKVATIFSYSANEEVEDGEILGDEAMDAERLDGSSRDFLEKAISDYNATFGTSYDTSSAKFENYYKDLAKRVKDRSVDLVLVVNMFLTGFDATTLNTLWVDKNLKSHGLIQAFSRTNRILNSVKAYGNIVCFRNLEKAVDDALALFGNREARGVVLLKPYQDYKTAYDKVVGVLLETTPPGEEPFGEAAEKRFVVLFGELLKLRNILTSFDEFAADDALSPRDLQNYTSIYNALWEKHRKSEKKEKESILDDVVFEIELVKQVEVNIDYILMLVGKWREAKVAGRETVGQVVDIEKAIDASPTLRNKRDLIMAFVDSQSVGDNVGDDWRQFIAERRESELDELIADEALKADETRTFVADAFRDGAVPTSGTAITRILPPASRFSKDNNHAAKKGRVLGKLIEFFERYAGLA